MHYKSVIPRTQMKISSPKSTVKSALSATLQDSPSFIRMKQLQDKWQYIQAELESEKITRIQSLENTLNLIIEKQNHEKPIVAAKFLLTKENIIKTSESLDCEKNDQELFDSKMTSQLKNLEENLLNKIEDQKIVKSSEEGFLLKDLDKKFSEMNQAIQYNNKSYQSKFSDQQNLFYNHIVNLKHLLDQQAQKRQNPNFSLLKKRMEGQNYLVNEIENEINKFQDLILNQKKFREESQLKLLNQIESLTKQTFSQIQKEEFDRKKSTDNLLKLLEDTCRRLDKSFKS